MNLDKKNIKNLVLGVYLLILYFLIESLKAKKS